MKWRFASCPLRAIPGLHDTRRNKHSDRKRARHKMARRVMKSSNGSLDSCSLRAASGQYDASYNSFLKKVCRACKIKLFWICLLIRVVLNCLAVHTKTFITWIVLILVALGVTSKALASCSLRAISQHWSFRWNWSEEIHCFPTRHTIFENLIIQNPNISGPSVAYYCFMTRSRARTHASKQAHASTRTNARAHALGYKYAL